MGCAESKISDVAAFVNTESSKFLNGTAIVTNHQENPNSAFPTILFVKPFEEKTSETDIEAKKPQVSSRTQEDDDDRDEKNYIANEWKQMIDKLRKNKKLNDYCLSNRNVYIDVSGWIWPVLLTPIQEELIGVLPFFNNELPAC